MKLHGNYFWPDGDEKTGPAVLTEVQRLPQYLKHVQRFRTCIQAGGNCGVYAQALSRSFKTVITAEPDPENMECLRQNVYAGNVVAHHAAFSDERGFVHTFRPWAETSNYGATMVMKSEEGVRTLVIDDAALESVDFIMLDAEGYELPILRGADKTVERCRPVISVEVKGLGTAHGIAEEDLHLWLTSRGYSMVEIIGKDRIYTP